MPGRIGATSPGAMDFSRAINIASVKTAPLDIWKDPVKHREYFNRVMTESYHAKPDQLIVDIACGRSSSPMPQTIKKSTSHDEAKPPVSGETELPVVCPGKSAQLDKELKEAFSPNTAPEHQTSDQPQIEKMGGGIFSVKSLTAGNDEAPPALTNANWRGLKRSQGL